MLRSKEYIIEFNKVKTGVNNYTFILDDAFLTQIEGAAYSKANVEASLQLLKSSTLYDLKFHLKGCVQCECDVCLEEFRMPIEADYKLLIKLSDTENYEDDEILYITEKVNEYNLAQYLYESLVVSIPTRKVCEMSGTKQCNEKVIAKLNELTSPAEDTNDEEGADENPTWDKLKDIFK